jgi:hypothetical protein
MKFYDAALANWNTVTFEPTMVVYYVERVQRDWRYLWLRKRWTSEVVKVSHYPDVKVKLDTSTYTGADA